MPESAPGFPGVSQSELDELHRFAEDYRAKLKAEREAIEAEQLRVQAERAEQKGQMQAKLTETKESYEKAFDTLPDNTEQSTPLPDGNHLVMRKSLDRIRMAVTTNPDKKLHGYLPTFDDISDWQEVTIDKYGRGGKTEAKTIFHWDKEALNRYTQDTGVYWGKAEQTPLDGKTPLDFDQLQKATESLSRAIPLPQAPVTA